MKIATRDRTAAGYRRSLKGLKKKAKRPLRKPRSGSRAARKPVAVTPAEIPQLRRPGESVDAWRARVQDPVKTGRLKLHKTTPTLVDRLSNRVALHKTDLHKTVSEALDPGNVALGDVASGDLKIEIALPKAKTDDEVAATIAARESPYGNYAEQCEIVDGMMDLLLDSSNWRGMQPDQREALHMIVVKVSRIANGDANYRDSWVDIGGYAMLVANRL